MIWLGLTGGIACGKSSVAKIIRTLGIPVLDADEISHQLTEIGAPGYKKIVEAFGSSVLQLDQSLDRRKLGQIVFGDKNKLKTLESLLHPLIQDRVSKLKAELEAKNEAFAFYDVPLLFEKHLESNFNKIVVVSCSEQQQKDRMKARSKSYVMSEGEIEDRLKSQIPLDIKTKKADFVVINDRGLTELENEVKKLLGILKALKSQN